jgi:hypothetical protein
MAANPTGCIEIAVKAKLLFMWYKIWICRVHVLWGWRNLFFVQRRVKVRWVAEIRIMGVQRMGIGVAL